MTTIADKDQPGPIGSTPTPTTSNSDPSASLAGVASTSSPTSSSSSPPPPRDLHHSSKNRASNSHSSHHRTSVHQHGSSSLDQKPPLSGPIVEAEHEHTSLRSSSSSRPRPGAGVGGPTDGSEPSGTGTDHGRANGDGMSPAVSTTSIMTSKSRSQRPPQTLLTRALLSYLSLFRVVQPLVSLGAFGTITPVLTYFRNQTIFPAIQATLYVFTATLACCSLFFSILYMVDVLYRKPLFWPFTNRHFRHSSKARIGGDLIVCMVFSGLWFLALVGLVIDTLWVDCGRLKGLERVFLENRVTEDRIKTVCKLEKATLGLSVICWACWVGVLLVLLYGHFWKRRQIIAERLRQRLSRGRTSRTRGGANSAPAGVSSAVSGDGTGVTSGSISGRLIGSGSGTGGGGDSGSLNESSSRHVVPQPSDDCGCQDMEGEVGLTGIICRYEDDQSSLGQGSKRDRPYSGVEA